MMRARFRHAAFTRAPIWLSRGRLANGHGPGAIQTTQRTITLPDLPDALDGLRIAHLSDLHVGDLFKPEHLPRLVELCHALEPDLIAVTGDFVDLSLHRCLRPVVEAMTELAAPMGVHFCIGNHDYLDDGPRLVRRFHKAGLNLMVNQAVSFEAKGHRVTIGGIDYSDREHELAHMVRQTAKHGLSHGKPDLHLLLSHHPHAFDEASHHGVNLTLSGHTHGGQLVLRPRNDRRDSFGLGNLSFRYPGGLYQRGPSYLYVTTGVGSWFPLRVRCPAEIACLTLRSGPILPGP
jgi:predicted MPP superfamily phosphohydrolase